MKRIFSLALVFALLTSCGQGAAPSSAATAGTPTPQSTAAVLSAASPDKLTVVLTDCDSVFIQEAEGEALSFDGPKDEYDCAYAPETGTMRITQRSPDWGSPAVLTVPLGVYKTIRVEARDSAFSLVPRTAYYEVKANDCAAKLTIPGGYTGTLYSNLKDCAVSYIMSEAMKNYHLTLRGTGNAVRLPEGWGGTRDQSFSRAMGAGGARLDWKHEDCAVSVEETPGDFLSRYQGSSTSRSTMMKTSAAELCLSQPTRHDDADWTVKDWNQSFKTMRADAKDSANTVTAIQTIPADGITALRVNADLCGVVLEPSQSGAFELSYVGAQNAKDIAVSAEVKDGALTVTADGTDSGERYICASTDYRVNCVRVGVPQGTLKSLVLDNGLAIIATYGLTLPAIIGSAGGGMILFNTDTLTIPLTMDTGNGCIALTAKSIAAAVTLSASNGSVSVIGDTVAAPVKLQASNGSVEMKASTVSGPLELTATNGSVNAELDRVADAVIKANNGSVEAKLGTITGDVTCAVTNGTLEAELTRRPTDLTFHVTGGWENRNWDRWDQEDWGDGKAHDEGLPDGWHDGLVIGSGKPSLTLSASTNGFLSFAAP